MKQIYLVSQDEVCDFEDFYPIYKAFEAKEAAVACFKQYVKEAKEIAEDKEWVVEETDSTFCAYEDASYSRDHINIRLTKIEVQ